MQIVPAIDFGEQSNAKNSLHRPHQITRDFYYNNLTSGAALVYIIADGPTPLNVTIVYANKWPAQHCLYSRYSGAIFLENFCRQSTCFPYFI
jgi:hypothetical protein